MDEIVEGAQSLATTLNRLVDLVEARERGSRKSVVPASRRALCLDSDLDFIADENGYAIGPDTGRVKRDRTRFGTHLALCGVCGLKVECLQMALARKEIYGIWGGTLPYERKKL
jgi:hypothetical protein